MVHNSTVGDMLYVIESFHALPKGEGKSWNTAKEFFVGECVRFVSFRWNEPRTELTDPLCLVTVETMNGTRYEAREDYFVGKDTWERLLSVFVTKLKTDDLIADTTSDNKLLDLGLAFFVMVVCGVMFWVCAGGLYFAQK